MQLESDYTTGMKVLHKVHGECIIVDSHFDDIPNIYYTLKTIDTDREIQSIPEFLSHVVDIDPELTNRSSEKEKPSITRSSVKKSTISPYNSFKCTSAVKLPAIEECGEGTFTDCLRSLMSSVPLARDTLPR